MNATANYSVLLLEDEKTTREYLVAMIKINPHLTLFAEAADCAQARTALQRGKPDILVADIGLPDGSGIDIIREARNIYPDLEAMVITVLGDEANVVHALEAGATGYLLKEQAFDELGNAILSMMRGESAISAKVARFLLKRFNVADNHAATVTARPVTPTHQRHEQLQLTDREKQVLNCIAKGYSYNEVAESLTLSTNTIRAHIRNIYRKLSVRSRSEAIYEATNMGLISLTH